MKKLYCLLFTLWLIFQHAHAQTSPQLNSSEILLGLEKLNTVGSVLYIAAHPDDENTRLLSYYSKEKKLRTAYLSLTRGDGGQNLIGKEQGDALGLLRTQELLAARRVDGSEQFFTRANDFGFSKSPEETLSKWNKDSILADVVWVIRNFRPDVIICRFPTTGEGGHGHHTASAIIALEAFDAAADPNRYPNQLSYVQIWQARRIFWNTFNFGSSNNTPVSSDQLQLDVGVYNPLLGKSFVELSAESRSMHKSQGFGTAKARGEMPEHFKLMKGDSAKSDLFEGIDLTWKRFALTASLETKVNSILKKYNPRIPELIIDDLIVFYKQLLLLDEKDPSIAFWKKEKLKETQNLLLACSGLWMEAYATEYASAPGSPLQINAQLIKRNNCDVRLEKINYLQLTDTLTNLVLNTNRLTTFKHIDSLPKIIPFSNPYWLNEKHTTGMFTVKQQLLIGKAENNAACNVTFYVTINGLKLEIKLPLVYKYVDPAKGELYRPFEVLPPATVSISEKVFVFSQPISRTVSFIIKANTDSVNGAIHLVAPPGWSLTLKKNDFTLAKKNDEAVIEATITPQENSSNGKLEASLEINGKTYTKSIRRIEYDHIPCQFILSDAEAELIKFDLKKSGTNIGYIPGAGDELPACLKEIGFSVTELTDELLSSEDLSKFNAIITGIRAYNTSDRLQVHYNKLMEYVKSGGNLIVQYNTNNRLGPLQSKIGPYPFSITRSRVTNEDAEVKILKPAHPVFNFPNVISEKDFENWVQERGIYFAGDTDKNYETLLSMSDPGEKASEGSLIIAKYGKGNFAYTGLVFFRELPAGVPGAYRLLVNLLSLPKNK
ncbi:MAG: PIG-L family deacetylase [Bacteroidia bacterium]|nr:PIG-L family deacetylase [Bacteroidia bacterium]